MLLEPIILVHGGGADVFRTKEDAERYTEPIDIEDGEYVASDALGRLLRLTNNADGRRGHLMLPDPAEDRSEELSAALRTMLGHIAAVHKVGFERSYLEACPLDRLIEISAAYYSR